MKMLSVVVPVYNAGEFLPGLFDKLSVFPEEKVDIILINDGSTDSSQSLCKAISMEKNNFFLFDQPNSGVSHARNSGIKQVTSEYIWFCDPDDDFEAQTIFNLLEQALNDYAPAPEVISFSYEIFFTDSKKVYTYNFDDLMSSGLDVIARFNNYEKKNNLSTVWNKLFKTSLIHENNIFFDEDMHHSEDRVFNIHAFQKAERVLFSPEVGYRYIKYTSGTLTTRYDQGRAVSTKKADEIMMDHLNSNNFDTSHIRDRMIVNYISLTCENAIRGDISISKGYSDFHREFSKARTEQPIKATEGGVVSRLSCYFINYNLPFFFYCLFFARIKIRGVLNKFK